MIRYSKDGISVLVVQDRRRMKKNGLYPVKVEVVYRRRQKYFWTGKDLSIECWNSMMTGKRKSEIKASIENSFLLIAREVDYLVSKGEFSFPALELRLGRKEACTLNRAMEIKMEECMSEGRINSFYSYRSTLLNLEKYAGRHIEFKSVTVKWLEECERRWRSENKSPTTINIYMKHIKSTLNDACRSGQIKESAYPFGKGRYEIPAGNTRKLALNMSQIKSIMEYKGDRTTEKYRDLWLFSYLCNGINFRDMLFLKYSNIRDGEICFYRSKTNRCGKCGKEIRACMTKEMKNIIMKWGNRFDGNPDTYLFKYASGKESEMQISNLVRQVTNLCNNSLKKISGILGIPKFTTYSARHSFATVLKRAGIDITFISESLGHSSLSMTQNYLAAFEHEERVKNARLLTKFSR